MKKGLHILLFCSVVPFLCIAQEFNSGLICALTWGTDPYGEMQEFYTMEFKKDGSWQLSCLTPGFVSYASGSYELLDKDKIITHAENQFDLPEEISIKNLTWSFSLDDNSINYYYKLTAKQDS